MGNLVEEMVPHNWSLMPAWPDVRVCKGCHVYYNEITGRRVKGPFRVARCVRWPLPMPKDMNVPWAT